ncbi:MAG TPA: hypothetical protein VFV17_10345, partial [Usitatibacteraceae bacterium]|nr:hypothetical protein [Usitatibacteraceae bacterium]
MTAYKLINWKPMSGHQVDIGHGIDNHATFRILGTAMDDVLQDSASPAATGAAIPVTVHRPDSRLQRWPLAAVRALFELPFADLIDRAHQVHRAHHDPNAVQLSTLLSIKTGGCSEDCGYCP